MASNNFSSMGIPLLMVMLFSIQFLTVSCVEFHVGGENGWAIPSKNYQLFNDWASKNRFKMNDTLRFMYKKDSVLVVSEEDYEKCRSSKPMFFSNNGNTVYTLDRSGLYYFISGVSGHCQRGLKMIIKVLEIQQDNNNSPPPQSANETTSAHSGAVELAAAAAAISSNLLLFIVGAFFL